MRKDLLLAPLPDERVVGLEPILAGAAQSVVVAILAAQPPAARVDRAIVHDDGRQAIPPRGRVGSSPARLRGGCRGGARVGERQERRLEGIREVDGDGRLVWLHLDAVEARALQIAQEDGRVLGEADGPRGTESGGTLASTTSTATRAAPLALVPLDDLVHGARPQQLLQRDRLVVVGIVGHGELQHARRLAPHARRPGAVVAARRVLIGQREDVIDDDGAYTTITTAMDADSEIATTAMDANIEATPLFPVCLRCIN